MFTLFKYSCCLKTDTNMEIAIKTTLAKKNSEMEKLEQSKKSHLRMISSSAAKLRARYGKADDLNQTPDENEAKNIRMYESHYPGFCYLRNGDYRKKITNSNASSSLDPLQCSEKVKAILFTDNELDVYKTMCLHLLGTHVQKRSHIQRKDGRLCSYVKAQTVGNVPHSLQTATRRLETQSSLSSSRYDKMLPRYVLDVKLLQQGTSTVSMRMSDVESGSDEESKKKRKLQVPIYINNEIKMIINSVLEALEAVSSPKLKRLTDLASSPEELRNMLANEDLQDFIVELANNPLLLKPTSYDFVVAHLMFDKIPEKGTLETVAQVLEVYNDSELKTSLCAIRKSILQRHVELVNYNIPSRKKIRPEDKISLQNNNSKASTSTSSKFQTYSSPASEKSYSGQKDVKSLKDEDSVKRVSIISRASPGKENESSIRQKSVRKTDSRESGLNVDKTSMDDHEFIKESIDREERSIYGDSKDSEYLENDRRFFSRDSITTADSIDANKWDFNNLSNSQRILLGLKIASLKCKPINMHQFEGKKKINLAAIMNPIIRPQVTDVDYKQHSPENHLRNFALPEKKTRKPSNKISMIETSDLENLTRSILANLRLEISEAENRKRVSQFMASI